MLKDKGKKYEESRRPYMKTVKEWTHKKNRRATKQALTHREYDKIPQDDLVKEEDPWGWD